MGLLPFSRSKYEIEYVPQRLRSLDVCVVACHAVLSGTVEDTPSILDFGAGRIELPNLKLMVDLAIDAGLMANRTLLNFVGIKLDNGGLVTKSYALTIKKYGLSLTSVADAAQVLEPKVPAAMMTSIWVEALSTASNSIAHFTDDGATIRVAQLGYASYATSLLVRSKFYDALGLEAPASLIPIGKEPSSGGIWDGFDPRLNHVC